MWLKMKDAPSGGEVWMNFNNVAYFFEVFKDEQFSHTYIAFCAKGDYAMTFSVLDRIDEIKTRLAILEKT